MAKSNETKTRADLIEAVSKDVGLTKQQTDAVVKSVQGYLLSEVLSIGNTVQLRNFGVFKQRVRDARSARNPRTGETFKVSGSKQIVFKPSKAFRAAA